jgi:hypothetical protein
MQHIWGKGGVLRGFWWGNLSEGGHLEDSGIYWRIILNQYSRSRMEGTDRIDLAQDRDRWRTVVKAVMNLRVP